MIDLKIRLEKIFKKVDIPKPDSLEPLICYIETLREWNKNVALISKKENNIVNNLIAPSLLFFKFFKESNIKVVDIGSGAGFPALVLKIYKPILNITMVESNYKKTSFLHYICAKLSLDCHIINNRIENINTVPNCNVITVRALNIKSKIQQIKNKIKGDYLFYITAKDNRLGIELERKIFFRNNCVGIYKL